MNTNRTHEHDIHEPASPVQPTHAHPARSSGRVDDTSAGAEAVARAEGGVAGWEDAVRLQRWAIPDHADFYALAGEIVATLHALEDLAHILARQIAGYGHGRVLYDDTRHVDPAQRLLAAGSAMQALHGAVSVAAGWANEFWSAVGHIGVEHTSADDIAEDITDIRRTEGADRDDSTADMSGRAGGAG